MRRFNSLPLIITFFLVLYTYSVAAQSLRFGVKAGINVSDFVIRTNAFGSDVKNIWKPTVLSHIGGTIEKTFNSRLGVQGELLYAINGSNLQITKSYAHFLSVPILLNIYATKGIVFEAGPQAGVIYKSKKSLLLIDSDFDFAAVAGCRANVSPHFNIGLRFVQGLAPLANLFAADEQGNVRSIHDFYVRNLQFSVIYQITR